VGVVPHTLESWCTPYASRRGLLLARVNRSQCCPFCLACPQVVKLARELPKTAVENTNFLDDDDQQLLEDEGETVLEREGHTLEELMRAQPRTKEDIMRDELFSTSRACTAAQGEVKGLPLPPPPSQYHPEESVEDLPVKESRVGGEPVDVQPEESDRMEEEGKGEEEGELSDIN